MTTQNSEIEKLERLQSDVASTKSMVEDLQMKGGRQLVHVKFVGICFEKDTWKQGEETLNDAIEHGYEVIKDYPTGAGVVITLGLYK